MRKRAVKKTVSLQPDVWEYISRHAGQNVSAFINRAVRAHRKQIMRRDLIEGYEAMAADVGQEEELRLWDTALLDGLSDEDDSAG